MIIIGFLLILAASLLDLKPPGGRAVMVCGIVLLIVGAVLAVSAGLGHPLIPYHVY